MTTERRSPFPANSITKNEIQRLQSYRAKIKTLADELEVIKAAEAELEIVIAGKIDQGAANRSGFELSIRGSERRFPRWKELFISRLSALGLDGTTEADAELTRTPATVYRNVVVGDAAQKRRAA